MQIFRLRFSFLFLCFLWGCPEPAKMSDDPMASDQMMDQRMMFNDQGLDLGEADQELDQMLEPEMCAQDSDCFAGRICVEGQCADAECQINADCPIDRPRCFGLQGEDPNQRRGRCGNCEEDLDCFGEAQCVIFATGEAEDGESEDNAKGGICLLEGSCNGSLECAPASRSVLRGPQSEICLDRQLSEQEPTCTSAFNCQGEDECPEGLTCSDSGVCLTLNRSQTCSNSLECGFGEVCRQEGVCGPCSSDQECGSAQSCQQGQCVEVPGACMNDQDCLGVRRCILNECVQPECEEDLFGQHISFETAVEIEGDRVYRQLMSCEDDWYKVVIAPAMSALISVRQLDRGANLGILVMDADQRELGRAIGPAPFEAVRLRESAAPREVWVRVFQEGPQSAAAYELEIAYAEVSEDLCLDDPQELNGGDDSIETAKVIRIDPEYPFPDQVQGSICPNDQDVLCFEMRANELLTITGEVALGDALVQGQLVNANGEEIAVGQWASDLNPEDISTTLVAAGTYCLILTSDIESTRRLGYGQYKLELNGVSPELANLCDSSEEISLDQNRGTLLGELNGSLDVLRASCASESDGPESAYYFDILEPSLVVARVSGLPTGSLGDPVISLRQTCDQESSEVACNRVSYDPNLPFFAQPNPAQIRVPVIPPIDPVTGRGVGRYTLIVDGINVGDDPAYQVDVELRPLAPPPVNDTCGRPFQLTFQDGVSVMEGYLDQAKADLDTCGQNGPDLTYTFTLEEAADVLIQATSRPAEFPVIISLSDRCGGAALECGFNIQTSLEAGTYHLTLAGLDAQSRGLVEMQVSLNPVMEAQTNETCMESEVLDGSSGSITGYTSNASDDYQLDAQNTCTRHSTQASDVVYQLQGQAGIPLHIEAIPEGGWDLALYLLGDCPAENVEQACLVGQDGALTEEVDYTPTSDGPIYIVIDGSNGESGSFTLNWEYGSAP